MHHRASSKKGRITVRRLLASCKPSPFRLHDRARWGKGRKERDRCCRAIRRIKCVFISTGRCRRLVLVLGDSRVLRGDLLPLAVVVGEACDDGAEVLHRDADLLARVPLAERDGSRALLALEGLVVDGDGERDADLVGSRVALADGLAGLVDAVRDAVLREEAVDLVDDGLELLVLLEREDGHLVRGEERRERQHAAVGVLGAVPERVLEQAVEDAPDAERRLDDVRDEHVAGDLLLRELEADHRAVELRLVVADLHDDLAARLHLLGVLLGLLGAELGERLDDRLRLLAVLLADGALLDLGDVALDDLGLLEALVDGHRHLGAVLVALQVEARSVRVADALDPAVRRSDLGVPAVACVVRHLGRQVLSEADVLGVHAALDEEEERARHEVAERLVVDDALRDRVGDAGHDGVGAALELALRGQQRDLGLLLDDLVLVVDVVLRLGVDKVLDLGEGELSHAEQPGAGRDLVPERLPDLGDGERDPTAVVVEDALEVHENALGGLRAQEAGEVAGGPDGGAEHQVERARLGQVVAGAGGLHAVFGDGLLDLLLLHVVDARDGQLELLLLLRGDVRGGGLRLERSFEHVVGTVARFRLRVSHHQVRELGSVTRDTIAIEKKERKQNKK